MGELEENLKAFEEQLPKLLETNEGRFAVVGRKSSEENHEVECWDTYPDAIQYAYKRYGLKPFLVKRVVRIEIPIRFTRDIFYLSVA